MKYLENENIDKLKANRIKKNETFSFECHSELKCFNLCCRNLNLFLYPYDIIRLKQRLGISSDTFIDEHTDIIMRKENFFPDVLLRMSENEEKTCPFLTKSGCSVYEDRPYSCRTFPLEQGTLYHAESDSTELIYFFRPPNFCEGKKEKKEWSTDSWMKDQDALAHNKSTIKWAKVKSLFPISPPWAVSDFYNPKLKSAFMAAYNIDKFREFIFSSTFLRRYKIKPALKRKIKKDDFKLSNVAFAWIKLYLWNIESKPIKILT